MSPRTKHIGNEPSERMRGGGLRRRQWRKILPRHYHPSSRSLALRFLPLLAVALLAAPVFFHFRISRLDRLRQRKCGWLENPPMVCAHGGDSSNFAPNTMDAYHSAIDSHVDCMEIDVSRSADGVLFALHDRDLQRLSGNTTAKIGYWSMDEIKRLDAGLGQQNATHGQHVPTMEEALLGAQYFPKHHKIGAAKLVSGSVKQIIVDAKVGPPLFEKRIAKDIRSVIEKTDCKNCLVWSKSDMLVRDVLGLSQDDEVGYIIMNDPSTGKRDNILRIKDARVAGIYHPLIDEKLVNILHGRGKKAYAWTVDDEASMLRMLQERVDAIITGHPSLLQGIMETIKIECMEEGFRSP